MRTVEYVGGRVEVWLIDGSVVEFSGSLAAPIVVYYYTPDEASKQLAQDNE